MGFYHEQIDQDRIYEGLDVPGPSHARIMLDLYALQEMSPEARLAKAERLEKTFREIEDKWAARGFNGRL